MGCTTSNDSFIPVVKQYKGDREGVILACYYNPEKNPFRSRAFTAFYNSINHMNYRIVELAIEGAPFELKSQNRYAEDVNIKYLRSDTHLWHKESLLNYLLRDLPQELKYIFWYI